MTGVLLEFVTLPGWKETLKLASTLILPDFLKIINLHFHLENTQITNILVGLKFSNFFYMVGDFCLFCSLLGFFLWFCFYCDKCQRSQIVVVLLLISFSVFNLLFLLPDLLEPCSLHVVFFIQSQLKFLDIAPHLCPVFSIFSKLFFCCSSGDLTS